MQRRVRRFSDLLGPVFSAVDQGETGHNWPNWETKMLKRKLLPGEQGSQSGTHILAVYLESVIEQSSKRWFEILHPEFSECPRLKVGLECLESRARYLNNRCVLQAEISQFRSKIPKRNTHSAIMHLAPGQRRVFSFRNSTCIRSLELKKESSIWRLSTGRAKCTAWRICTDHLCEILISMALRSRISNPDLEACSRCRAAMQRWHKPGRVCQLVFGRDCR